MTKETFNILPAAAFHECLADRQGGNERSAALRITSTPRRFRINVKPGLKSVAFRGRCGGGRRRGN
jgi:hypothetical protein